MASEEANRDRWGGGVPNADGVEERRRRCLGRAASPGEENVLPIGLERESSGDEGPEKDLNKLGMKLRKPKIESSRRGRR